MKLDDAENVFQSLIDFIILALLSGIIAWYTMLIMGRDWGFFFLIFFVSAIPIAGLIKSFRVQMYLLIFGIPIAIAIFGPDWFYWLLEHVFARIILFVAKIF